MYAWLDLLIALIILGGVEGGGVECLNQNDVNLIRTAKRGHGEAFTMLVRNYKNFVFQTAYGVVRSKPDAEDITQEAFMKVHQSLKGLHDERAFPTWLARITVRTALDWLHRNEKHRLSPLDPDEIAKDANHAAELRLDLEQALGRLNHEQRSILVLRELQGFDYEELSKILDIPVGTVRSRLHHARAQLRLLLANERGNAP